jgi:hypothetical protein
MLTQSHKPRLSLIKEATSGLIIKSRTLEQEKRLNAKESLPMLPQTNKHRTMLKN